MMNPELTERELEVLRLFHKKREDIAESLCITIQTVMTHVHRIFMKLNAKNRTEAMLIALKEGYIKLEEIEL